MIFKTINGDLDIHFEYSNQLLRRLIKDGKLDLVENEDYRVSRKGIYLFEDTAIEKLLAYKESSPKCKNQIE